jgi:hypothetical protein
MPHEREANHVLSAGIPNHEVCRKPGRVGVGLTEVLASLKRSPFSICAPRSFESRRPTSNVLLRCGRHKPLPEHFTMEFSHYDPVPKNVADEVIAEVAKRRAALNA